MAILSSASVKAALTVRFYITGCQREIDRAFWDEKSCSEMFYLIIPVLHVIIRRARTVCGRIVNSSVSPWRALSRQ
jgi:hypothetical protein